LLATAGSTTHARADSIWERRNPYFAYMHQDLRARQIGDLLTIVVREVTLFDGKEDRKLNKDTRANFLFNLSGSTQGGASTRSFDADLEYQGTSQRQFNGKADYKSDRTFTDRMSVAVVDVLPNGVLVIEGIRKRVVATETKVLRVTGLVRPQDVGPDNIVQSQFIANFQVSYLGRGTDTDYTRHGWLGRIVNKIWPF
jgi:flagellar L-ring protein precursor FlgH